MNDLTKARNIIIKYEGFSAKAYICPAGKRTIGYGQVIKDGQFPDGITKEEATAILTAELYRLEEAINRLVTVKINNNQLCALISLCYNIGIGNFQNSTLLKLINAGQLTNSANSLSIINNFLRWVHVGRTKMFGLIRRRLDEANLFYQQ